MSNITYLLGAGASCKALPLVNGIADQVQFRYNQVAEIDYSYKEGSFAKSKNINDEQSKKLKHLYGSLLDHFYDYRKGYSNPVLGHPKANAFATIDIYLKSLFHKDKFKFEAAKLLLDQFFILEQIFWHVEDHRYLNLLTSISNLRYIDKQIQFITWNYDFLLQKTGDIFEPRIMNMRPNNIWDYRSGLINTFPRPDRWGIVGDFLNSECNLLHLNGRCGLFIEDKPHVRVADILLHKKIDDRNFMVDFILDEYIKKKRLFTFAWEDLAFDVFEHPKSYLEAPLLNAEVLVVIGYSFPFFNREIDAKIFTTAKKLKKIVYQQPNQLITGESLRKRFQIPDAVLIEDEYDCSQFHIPIEL